MNIRTPELSVANILKPFAGFESKYQGVPVESNPIAIPGNLDFLAGKPGFDPSLLAGVPVPIGSDALLYFPRITAAYGVSPPIYSYTVIWRMRALLDANDDPNAKLAGNLGRRLTGIPDTSGSSPGPRNVIPAAVDTTFYLQSEPANETAPGIANIRSLERQILGGEWQAPLSPNFPSGSTNPNDKLNNAGIVSQGLYADTDISGIGSGWARAGFKGGPNYNAEILKVKGNELIILVTRAPGTDANWDFGGVDLPFSEFFGTANNTRPPVPDTGIQLYTGSFV